MEIGDLKSIKEFYNVKNTLIITSREREREKKKCRKSNCIRILEICNLNKLLHSISLIEYFRNARFIVQLKMRIKIRQHCFIQTNTHKNQQIIVAYLFKTNYEALCISLNTINIAWIFMDGKKCKYKLFISILKQMEIMQWNSVTKCTYCYSNWKACENYTEKTINNKETNKNKQTK